MKTYVLLFIMGLLSISCKGQNNEAENDMPKKENKQLVEQPKGAWKVDKEFDEHGNLIRYDSIYSWSSKDNIHNLSSLERDSLIQSFKSKFFTSFSKFENEGVESIFSQDSLFNQRFFNDDFFESDFGADFMDLEKIKERIIKRQQQFLEKYQLEFINPENEN